MKMGYCSGLLGVALGGVAACSSSTTGPSTPVSIVGTFALQTINGDTAPTLLSYSGGSETVVLNERDMISDVYLFNTDRTYSEQTVIRVTQGTTIKDTTETTSGTYAQQDTSLTITPNGGTGLQGTLLGAVLTLQNDSATYVYHKTQSD